MSKLHKKHWMRGYGKWLCKQMDAGEMWFTPMRYVSQEEIDEMMRRVKLFIEGKQTIGTPRVPIFYSSSWEPFKYGGYISKAGNYRVDAMPELKGNDDLSYYTTSFNSEAYGGIPEHHRCSAVTAYGHYKDRKYKEAMESKRKKESAYWAEESRSQWCKSNVNVTKNSEDSNFFKVLALTSAVGGMA